MSSARLLGAVVVSALSLAVAACGGDDDDGGFCESFEFQACGGDVVGEWSLAHVCPSASVSDSRPVSDDDPACADDLIRATSSFSDLTASFRADGTYTMTRSYSTSGTAEIDQDCTDALTGGQLTLQQMCDQAAIELSEDFTSSSCSVSDGVCRCTFSDTGSDSESGTYTVAGTLLTTTPDGGIQESVEVCVEGNQIAVHLPEPIGDDPDTYVIMTR